MMAAWTEERKAKFAAVMRGNRYHLIHGHATKGQSRTYYSWDCMVMRCTNPNNNRYYLYGARGITVCDGWRIFENFLADMGKRPAGKTLDRVDPNGNYEPGNCRWATPRQQIANRRPRRTKKTGSLR